MSEDTVSEIRGDLDPEASQIINLGTAVFFTL